jgi:cellulose synthase/poly-beta-1,6-N-acetylglucosamine synthase-like glycosyltransferase
VILSLAGLAGVAVVTLVEALRAGARRDDTADVHEPLAVSRFTIPVSVIVAVEDHWEMLPRTIQTLLDLTYPEFEVIVVADGLDGDVFERLTGEWGLDAKEFFYRHSIETATVGRIYRARLDSRLTLVDKAPAGRADALNCGANLARFRYLCTVPSDVRAEADALLRVMSPALRDPAGVLGVTSHVERRPDGLSARRSRDVARAAGTAAGDSMWTRITGSWQHLGSLRALMDSRLVWRKLGGEIGPHESVAVWRRDALIQLGGFSRTAADADLDMMCRLATPGPGTMTGRVVRSAEIFGRAEPATMNDVLGAVNRRQRAACEILGLGYFLVSELVTPCLQAWVVVATLAGAVAGWLPWLDVVLAIVLLSFGNAVVSGAALFLRARAPGAPEEAEMKRLLLTAPLEWVLYRPALACARAAAIGASLVRAATGRG